MKYNIFDRPVAFHRFMVDLTGSINAALMLSQAVYWQHRNEDGDWWFQSRDKWTAEIGLSRDEQETARRKLREHPFWHEELRGVPAKMYYKVDIDELVLQVVGDDVDALKRTLLVGDNPANRQATIPPATSKVKETKKVIGGPEHSLPTPTLEEVLQLASEKSVPENEAKMFFYHYDSVGWKSGKNQMKNWKSAFSGWVIRSEKYNTARKANPIAQRISIEKQIESIIEQIKEHPGNPEWIGYDQNRVKQQDRDDLQLVRKRLAELRKQQNTIT